MGRRLRLKIEESSGWYHLYARVASFSGEYLLEDKKCQRKVLELLKFYSSVYFARVAGFCVMGNHYHQVVEFEAPFEVPRKELRKRAEFLYPDREEELDLWDDSKWSQFESRLFDVSEYMRNFQSSYARWYNNMHSRKGSFWADRFKSTVLEDEQAVKDCLVYTELNPVRAGIVEMPEEYEGCSLYLREIGEGEWLVPLKELMFTSTEKQALLDYKSSIYYRGNVPSKDGQMSIPSEIVELEESRGFKTRGLYRKRLRYFVDGVALGSEEFVRGHLDALLESGQYLRRKNPLKQQEGELHSLKETRCSEVVVH